MSKLNRKQIRYLLRRIKTNEQTKADPIEKTVDLPKLEKGFKESFEKQSRFRGWLGYQVVWDVDKSGWTIVMLDESLESEWNKILEEKVPELTCGDESDL